MEASAEEAWDGLLGVPTRDWFSSPSLFFAAKKELISGVELTASASLNRLAEMLRLVKAGDLNCQNCSGECSRNNTELPRPIQTKIMMMMPIIMIIIAIEIIIMITITMIIMMMMIIIIK